MSIKKTFEIKYFKLGLKNIILYVINLSLMSFILYTVYLLYFSQKLDLFLNSIGVGEFIGGFLCFILSILSLGIFAYVSVVQTAFVITSDKNIFKYSIMIIEELAFLLSIAFWINPQLLISSDFKETNVEFNGSNFSIGQYPKENKLQQLKQEKFDYVVALLNPGAFPFEKKVLKSEIDNAGKIGIRIIVIPLESGLGNREEEIKRIDELLEMKQGKFYVHEFNGNNRIGLFREEVEKKRDQILAFQKTSLNKLNETKTFESGEIIKLDNNIFFTPYPTEKEILDFIIAPKVKSVVCLFNKNVDDSTLIEDEKKLLQKNSIPFFVKPVVSNPYNPENIFELSLFVRGLQRPVVIQTADIKSVISEGFLLTYKNQKKVFPPSLFEKPLQGGMITSILPNILCGPRPTLDEYKTRLYNCGVRGLIYCDTLKKSLKASDKDFFTNIGLTWEQVEFTKLTSRKDLKANGLWYLYGADTGIIQKQLK